VVWLRSLPVPCTEVQSRCSRLRPGFLCRDSRGYSRHSAGAALDRRIPPNIPRTALSNRVTGEACTALVAVGWEVPRCGAVRRAARDAIRRRDVARYWRQYGCVEPELLAGCTVAGTELCSVLCV